jgi:hypothetical protein
VKPKGFSAEQKKALQEMQGDGFISDALKKLAHGAVDFAADRFGGSVNPLGNPNEGLRKAIYEKKVPLRMGTVQ